VSGQQQDLGEIAWTPNSGGTFLWQLGRSDRTGGEFALASLASVRPMPREYEKPGLIPGDLTFRVGESWEPVDWYYAQTNPGTWAVRFELERALEGTAHLTVATSMQQRGAPTVQVNGSSAGVTGTIPNNNDSTIARQADRSGYPRTGVLSFPASLLVAGENEITFTHGAAAAAGTGPGWDTLLLEVDEGASAPAPRLSATAAYAGADGDNQTWRVTVRNEGTGTARDLRVGAVKDSQGRSPKVVGRDPNAFPVPVAALLKPGDTVSTDVVAVGLRPLVVAVTADGGRTTAEVRTRVGG
jgi:rhamnogalacturonan endolyase